MTTPRGPFTSNPLLNEGDFRGSAAGGGCITAKRALDCECPPRPHPGRLGRDAHPTLGHCRTCGRRIPGPAETVDSVRITLESTSEVIETALPARVWRGRSEDGTPIIALVTIAAQPSGDARKDARMRTALETRIASSAVITIPTERLVQP